MLGGIKRPVYIPNVDTETCDYRGERLAQSDLSSSRKRDTCTGPGRARGGIGSPDPSPVRDTPGGTDTRHPRSPSSDTSDATDTSPDLSLLKITSRDPSQATDTSMLGDQSRLSSRIPTRRKASSDLLRDMSAQSDPLNRTVWRIRENCSGSVVRISTI